MSGEPLWITVALAIVGITFVSEVFWRAERARNIHKIWKVAGCIFVTAIVGVLVVWASYRREIVVTVSKEPDLTNDTGIKFLGVNLHNNSRRDAVCKVYLIDLSKDGTPLPGFTKTKLELGARNMIPSMGPCRAVIVGCYSLDSHASSTALHR
jgi:hypothetical protein